MTSGLQHNVPFTQPGLPAPSKDGRYAFETASPLFPLPSLQRAAADAESLRNCQPIAGLQQALDDLGLTLEQARDLLGFVPHALV
jgi:hypothetical protein